MPSVALKAFQFIPSLAATSSGVSTVYRKMITTGVLIRRLEVRV